MTLNSTMEDKNRLSVSFRISHVQEFLCSIEAAINTWRFQDWTRALKVQMGENAFEEMHSLYLDLQTSSSFQELALEYPDQENLPGFFQFLESLSPKDFLFYATGRMLSPEELARGINSDLLNDRAEKLGSSYPPGDSREDPLLADPGNMQKKVITFWKSYYDHFYIYQQSEFTQEYHKSIEQWSEIVEKRGLNYFLESIAEIHEFPRPLPEHIPYTRLEVIPVHRFISRHRLFYGYGSLTLLLPSFGIRHVDRKQNALKEDLLASLKALSDPSRLDILRIISEVEYGLNGKKIAENLKLSPSVISRHLKQLKTAGLITEKTMDNRNFYYAINENGLKLIEQRLFYYLSDSTD